MNKLNLTQPGGLWIYQDTLDFMQNTYSPLLAAITSALGDNVIVSGCVQTASNVSAGWIILNGELLPYAGGVYAPNFTMQEVVTNEQFDDGTQKGVYHVRKAVMTISGGVPFSSFAQIKSLAAFRTLPTAAGSDYTEANDSVLATITGLFNLKSELLALIKGFDGIIVQWSGSVSAIPAGWVLCDGNNGSPDLRDKFVLGAGNNYPVGATGGEEEHLLTVQEMPKHSHGYTSRNIANADGNDNQRGVSGTSTLQTSEEGGDQPHNNMPPYYALAFIYRLPIS